VTLLDTHVLLWLRTGDARLGNLALREIDRAWHVGEVAVSAITFWEVALLHQKRRIAFSGDVSLWRREQLEQGLVEVPVDGEIGIRANSFAASHGDPADRIILATALDGHRLLTGDERILAWGGDLDRLDARM